ncbi:hypothetical protein [Apis mellifera associated microvirus 50]|nr:hypothetical protein [Apis mellifera associated microvirus 50]
MPRRKRPPPRRVNSVRPSRTGAPLHSANDSLDSYLPESLPRPLSSHREDSKIPYSDDSSRRHWIDSLDLSDVPRHVLEDSVRPQPRTFVRNTPTRLTGTRLRSVVGSKRAAAHDKRVIPVFSLRGLMGLHYRWPKVAIDCLRRKMRKEVIFAAGVGGRRRSAPGRRGKYRRTPSSLYRC